MHTTEPDDNIQVNIYIQSSDEKQEKKKILGGLGNLDMVCRWTFPMIMKTLFKNEPKKFFRIFYIIYSSF